MSGEPGGINGSGCSAWALPLDATCASAARHLLRDALDGTGMADELVHDAVTMASELATNTLHAHANIEFDGTLERPVAGAPELWLYVRGSGVATELVCKVFDSLRAWQSDAPPDPARVSPDAVSGRGLQVVAGLSRGRWGHHVTRARLGSWKVPGKVVWFGVPLPASCGQNRFSHLRPGTCQAADELQAMIADRGLGSRLVRCDERGAGISVLSVRHGLTVWCRGGTISWRLRGGQYAQRALVDIVDAAEEIVRAHEEMGGARLITAGKALGA